MSGSGAPLLIALPDGLNVSGVAAWAVRLANGLAMRGRGVAMLVHPEPEGQARVEFEISPRVRVISARGAGRFGREGWDADACVGLYRDAVKELASDFGGPVVVSPNLHGDCYGVAGALCAEEPELVRVVGWAHSDNEYDARVLAHYEAVVARFVGVSDRIEGVLRERVPGRGGDVMNVPYGVEVEANGKRQIANGKSGEVDRVRLVYSGRLEHRQKRVMALVHLSEELARRGVEHELTVAGDGRAAEEFTKAAAGRREIRMTGAVGPRRVRGLLREHDVLVLPSRFEGLSVSMLEAMAAGCVPVVARTASGAAQAIETGVNGEIADVSTEAGEEEVGAALAAAVTRVVERGLGRMGESAKQTVRERFSIERHVQRVAALIDEVAAGPARAWPREREWAFTTRMAGGTPAPRGTGSVPADGADRMRRVLEGLAGGGRSVVIHGTGEHTRQLAGVIVESPARIVAFADDDRARQGGRMLDWPIIAPGDAAKAGATDVVISSWMHEGAIWARRGEYERRGLRVWRVYEKS